MKGGQEVRKIEGIMIGNKNCKTCFGKGYYGVKHDLTRKNTVSCNCLRPLVREGDIDEVVKILRQWLRYYRNAIEILKEAASPAFTDCVTSVAQVRSKERNEEVDQNEQVADETDERDSGDH